MLTRLKKFFSKKQEPIHDEAEVESLRIAFKDRYHNFKLLLNANNKSLEIMANIEQVLQGGRPFGMSFVRANATGVAVNVFRMIRNLEKLAPEKYSELADRFNEIEGHIRETLTRKKVPNDERLLIPLSAIDKDMADMVGSKMANLGEIKNKIHLSVPGGFAVSSYAYQKFIEHNDLQAEIDKRFQSADADDMQKLYGLSAEIQQLIIRSEIPKELETAITEAWNQLEAEAGGKITAALRSSALGEDTSGSSFAGQYRSILNVSSENVFEAYREVVASKYSLPAITYRMNRGFRDEDISLCVGCVVMVDAASGGVIYSRNPVDMSDDSVFINSVWGLPKSVVDGSVGCDLFVVSRKEPMSLVHRDIKNKDTQFVCYPEEGVCRVDLSQDEKRNLPSLDEKQAVALAEFAVRMEDYYASPQDIEWAADHQGKVYILQCRPLQQTATAKAGNSGFSASVSETLIAKGGITASPGAAYGKVFRAEKAADVLRFPEHGILVIQQALPRWAPLLNRAAAVISEQGGFAGHLANVAREFDVPALFGISGVMNKLNTGDEVTVDADGCSIHKGKIESLLMNPVKKKNLMEGSPVYDTLMNVSKHIIPLNLTDPDSPEFKPSSCSTLHDITRFIHEKSVHEMFNFGKEHNFSERSGKQLFYKVPMQWWILNLDDGFRQEVNGKYVRLEDIASVPMLALWDGIVAIPWEGPPIDGKGLMSVMFQATANKSLATGVRSKYNDRNYFMISKNYCSLSSRLGFHFSTIEALIDDRPGENYISFQFKGGAADYDRRLRRVEFIRDILESHGFKAEVKEDSLFARAEGHEKEVMKHYTRVLGYLTIHTRQLDMIMSNEARLAYYRAKIDRDIVEKLSLIK